MHTADDSVHIVVNGELYDYDQLRSEMVDKNQYHFKGHSDSELVLALYQFYGMSFLSHLRGKFSLCLYDSARQLFIAARDRYGIKPLFWTINGGRLLVAAEAKAFFHLARSPNRMLRASWMLAGAMIREPCSVASKTCVRASYGKDVSPRNDEFLGASWRLSLGPAFRAP